MQTDIHFWSYLAQFFSEWEMFQTKVVEKIKTHILCSATVFRYSFRLPCNAEKYSKAKQKTNDNIAHVHAYWITKSTNTHLKYVIIIVFPLQRWGMNAHHCYVIRKLPVICSREFKIKSRLSQRMLAIIRCRIFCLPVWYPNIKIKLYKAVILPVVLYGCETWSFSLRGNVGWGCLRIGCWGEYLGPRGTR